MLLSALMTLSAWGKDYTPRDYSIVPPAPKVAALMDYKEYPVDYFRGVPKIDFPLYVLKVGQIEVPITLSYLGGGVRVDQKVGNAGLGWNVSCGATIAHTVNGAPDDSNHGIIGLLHQKSGNDKSFRSNLIAKKADYDPTDASGFKSNREWIAALGSNYYQGRADIANDLYSLSGQGLSATFTILDNNKPLVTSESPVKIELTGMAETITDGGCDGQAFMVTAPNGLKYQFRTQDRTKYTYHHGSPEQVQTEDSVYYASAWHLNKITDLCGNTVDFMYGRGGTIIKKDTSHPVSYGYSNPQLAAVMPGNSTGVGTVIYNTKTLSYISGDGIIVSFVYTIPPTGNSDARIDKIKIISDDGVDNDREICFTYIGNYLYEVIDQGETIYTFTYNAYNDRLPEFSHGEQDFGGYCNGIENSPNLIPWKEYPDCHVGFGADRNVNPDYAKEGSLKRIEYATGGYTEFEWESNNLGYLQSIPYYGSINETQITRVDVDTLRACSDAGYSKLKVEGWQIQSGQLAELDLTQYFNMNPANLFGSAYHDTHIYDAYPSGNPPHYPHIVIRNHSTRAIVQVIYLDKSTIEPDGVKEAIRLSLAPGKYDFELINPLEVQGAEDFINVEFQHGYDSGYAFIRRQTTDDHQTFGRENWCGLRIKRITSCAGTDENDILRKDYFYNRGGDPNETSGTVQMLPQYEYAYYKNLPCFDVPGYDSSNVYCVGEIAFPQSTHGSLSSIEYPVVSVRMGREDRMEPDTYLNYYFQTYCYSSSRDPRNIDYNRSDWLTCQPIGSRMYTSKAHWRGNLEKSIMNKYGMPGVVNEYAYNIYEKDDTPILTTDAFPICDFRMATGDNSYGVYDYGIGTYTLIPYNKTIASEIVRQLDGLETCRNYKYFYNGYTDVLDWNLTKSVTASDSEHGTTETFYTYMSGSGHALPNPETEIVVRDNQVISATRTEFDHTTRLPVRKYTLSSPVSPSSIVTDGKLTTSAQINAINKLTYEYRYNNRGNLVQISYKGTPLASYIWGYNGMYPILEASDTDYDTLVAAAAQSGFSSQQIEGRALATDASISSLAQQLRTRLPQSDVTAISYHWLLGVAKITSPRGDTASFSYDPRGRLIEVRDFNNHLINKYEYHYENIYEE